MPLSEGGTSTGALHAHLNRYYPRLRFRSRTRPQRTTIAANVMIHGQGRLTQQYALQLRHGFRPGGRPSLESSAGSVPAPCPTTGFPRVLPCPISPAFSSAGSARREFSPKVGLKAFHGKKCGMWKSSSPTALTSFPGILYEITHTRWRRTSTSSPNPCPYIQRQSPHRRLLYRRGSEELDFKKKKFSMPFDGFIRNKTAGYDHRRRDEEKPSWTCPAQAPRHSRRNQGGRFRILRTIIPSNRYPQCSRKLR